MLVLRQTVPIVDAVPHNADQSAATWDTEYPRNTGFPLLHTCRQSLDYNLSNAEFVVARKTLDDFTLEPSNPLAAYARHVARIYVLYRRLHRRKQSRILDSGVPR